MERYDLNIGITAPAQTGNTDNNYDKSYALIGLSHELNRSALFNIGWAFAPGDVKGRETQMYLGFTVDSNFLKAVGLVSK